MTDEMPPGRGFGAGPMDAAIMRGWWEHQHRAHWRAAISANMMNRMPLPAPYYRDLLSLAATLIAEARYEFRYELVVIVAQMACEVVVEQTVDAAPQGQEAAYYFQPRKSCSEQIHAADARQVHHQEVVLEAVHLSLETSE